MEGKPKSALKHLVVAVCQWERSGWVHPSLCKQLIDLPRIRPDVEVATVIGGIPPTTSRNAAVREFKKTAAGYLTMIDNDQPLPDNFPQWLDLVERGGKLIAGVPTPTIVVQGLALNVCIETGRTINGKAELMYPTEVPDQWLNVGWVGSGCVTIHRSVFERFDNAKLPYFRTQNVEPSGIPSTTPNWNEDVNFCTDARSLGIEVWAHGGFICHHFKEFDLVVLLKAYRSAVENYLGCIRGECAKRGIAFNTPAEVERRLLDASQAGRT